MQLPQASDYSACGPNTQIDYAIAATELCIMTRSIYRKAFGPLSNKFRRRDVLAEADKKLATWSLMLPQHLRLRPTLTLDLWPSTLHLMYNTILILLHRPRPQAANPPSSPSGLPTSNDADICSAAAGVVQSIFESLCDRGHLSSLWIFSVTTLFTTMIQLSVEVRFANPLLALAGVRRYDSTLYSLKNLAKFWPDAESILHFFENSEKLQRQNIHVEQAIITHEHLPGYDQTTLDDSMDGAIDEEVSSTTAVPENRKQKGWRQLFPFNNTLDIGEASDTTFLDQWTEMYWQEPFEFGTDASF